MTLRRKSFENMKEKEENACKQHCLLFPKCFLPYGCRHGCCRCGIRTNTFCWYSMQHQLNWLMWYDAAPKIGNYQDRKSEHVKLANIKQTNTRTKNQVLLQYFYSTIDKSILTQ